MTPTVSTSTCKYSTNSGSTWSSFTSSSGGVISVSTRFPNHSGTTSSILVRVGATLTSSTRQQRGSYSGTVTVSAAYN
jgi:hypothetical protein